MNSLTISLILMLVFGCTPNKINSETDKQTAFKIEVITTADYELHLPKKQDGLLILFLCFPCDAENTKTEFVQSSEK